MGHMLHMGHTSQSRLTHLHDMKYATEEETARQKEERRANRG